MLIASRAPLQSHTDVIPVGIGNPGCLLEMEAGFQNSVKKQAVTKDPCQRNARGIFRTISNIYDGVFMQELPMTKSRQIYLRKIPHHRCYTESKIRLRTLTRKWLLKRTNVVTGSMALFFTNPDIL